MLTNDIIKFFEENDITLFISFPCGNPSVCDAITNRNNSFEKIVTKLDLLKESKVKYTTNIVVTSLNLPYVKDTVAFLKARYNIKNVSITRAAKPANSDDTFDAYLLDREGLAQLQNISVALCKEFNISVTTNHRKSTKVIQPWCSFRKPTCRDCNHKKLCSNRATPYIMKKCTIHLKKKTKRKANIKI